MNANVATNIDQNFISLGLIGLIVLAIIVPLGMVCAGVFDEMGETTKAMEARLLRMQKEQSEIDSMFYRNEKEVEEVESEFSVLIRNHKNATAKPKIPSIYASCPSRYVARKVA